MIKEGVVITEDEYPDIYDWLLNNIQDYEQRQKQFTLTSEGKINNYCGVVLDNDVTNFKYHFEYVRYFFSYSYSKINSLIGSPKEIDGNFYCINCKNLTSFIGFPKYIKGIMRYEYNKFSNDPKNKEKYKLYLAMWLELFESVSNEERKEYITNYKDKTDYLRNPIIPIEILKEYGF